MPGCAEVGGSHRGDTRTEGCGRHGALREQDGSRDHFNE
ncbi:hypothetical protein MPS_3323 [Mycobacterium pseudoshottsii JCM 15466]|nr:hypothetical protein MPS_3323 [Mycobacterium pseudoshottsii JCM 15466]